MAEEKAGEASAEKGTPPALEKARGDEAEVVSVELAAPAGWMKKDWLGFEGGKNKSADVAHPLTGLFPLQGGDTIPWEEGFPNGTSDGELVSHPTISLLKKLILNTLLNILFILNEDGSPRRNEIVFISPTGEEIKNKRQLQQYLKSNPGGPPSSEFDWGTGDTPRRSARIRERAKAVETPEDEKPKKRERKSSSKKTAKDKKDDGDAVDETSKPKEDVTTEEAKAPADAEMKEAEDTDEAKDKADDATATAVNEGIISEAAENEGSGEQDPNKDTAVKAATEGEGAGAKDNPILGTNRSVSEKTDASLENAKPADKREESTTTGQEHQDGESPLKNGIRKEDPDAAVPKDVPSVNCSDGQHLRKASPVNC